MNVQTNAHHLSEDQLDDVLLGFAPAAASEHVAACAACRDRVATFESQLGVFNQASRDWSEARSNTISRDLAAHRPTLRLTPAALWSSTAAAVLAVAFTLTINLHRDSASLQSPDDALAEASPSLDSEIASDNAMLAAIDSETATPRPARFGLHEGSKARSASAPRAVIRQVKE
jgi:hypothetical protein